MGHFCIRQLARNVLKSRSKRGAGIRHGISALGVERVNAYDNTNKLSLELGVGRCLLYNWRFAVFCTGLCQRGGHFALNPQNRRFPDFWGLPSLLARSPSSFPAWSNLRSGPMPDLHSLGSLHLLRTIISRERWRNSVRSAGKSADPCHLLPDPSGKPPVPGYRHTDLVKSGRLTGGSILAGCR